ncbi:MAG: RNA-binding cell elongation regulator Jag/EloR [Acidimicrobiales bacterium]|nr:RNA-binding cell elongation regulator Jag/EloR [Acidimicrobiales bacterium]
MEWVESTGSSIDEAKERALDRLGVHNDDAEFEVVADVTTGLFGRVKEEARVRARVAPATPRAKDDRRRGKGLGTGRGGSDGGGRNRGRGGKGGNNNGGNTKGGANTDGKDDSSQKSGGRAGERESGNNGGRGSKNRNNGNQDNNRKSAAKPAKETKKDAKMSDDEPTMPLPEQADLAEAFVTGLAERFGTSVSFQREDVEEDEIRITVSGDDLGRMIGRRGTTAGAIDELVRTVLQRQAGSSRNGRIRVDVGGVRARRSEALANFARAQAAEVRESGSARSLEPMSAADRKVVHDALTDEDGIDTESEGEDNRRRVVIVPDGASD